LEVSTSENEKIIHVYLHKSILFMESPLYESVCQYAGCGKTFQSKRRWVKKYCSDSCRTLASRYRLNGLGGSKIETPRSKGVNDLYKSTSEFQSQLMERFRALDAAVAFINQSAFNIDASAGRQSEALTALYDRINKEMSQQEQSLMKLSKQLETLHTELKALSLAVSDVRNRQSTHDLVVVLSSILGPHLLDSKNAAEKTTGTEQGKQLEEFLRRSDEQYKKNKKG